MAGICGQNVKLPVLPAPSFFHGAILPFPLCQSLHTGSSPGLGPHQMDQPSCWTACNRMVCSTTLPFVQHFFLPHLLLRLTGVVTHLLTISHSLWALKNHVVHDWKMDGLAMLLHSKLLRNFTPSLCLDSKTSPLVSNTTLKNTLWILSCVPL